MITSTLYLSQDWDKEAGFTYPMGMGFVVGMNKHSNRHTPQREVQVAFKVLMTHWFCNSHDVSHFAAFFIDMGAKTSVAESVFSLIVIVIRENKLTNF